MAQQALDVVESKKLRLIPDVHVKIWEHWLVNIRDWCISRQLWWGHRIPAYLVSLKDQPPADDTEKEIWVRQRICFQI
jgi:valyl-tRNA synthetase